MLYFSLRPLVYSKHISRLEVEKAQIIMDISIGSERRARIGLIQLPRVKPVESVNSGLSDEILLDDR